jgi:two-component system phosphate regulon sensor histidine kinase PhoR
MKKIFPVIVVLITLSLLGIMALQVSWFKNLLLVQQERFLFRVERAAEMVANDLSKYATSSAASTPFKEDENNAPAHISLSHLYTAAELKEKIDKAFEYYGLKHINFEFALVSNGSAELQSPGFYEEILDTVNNKVKGAPIFNGAEFNSGVIPSEGIQVIIVNFEDEVYQSLTWMLAGAVAFTLIILAAFFLTVRTLLVQKKLARSRAILSIT